MYDHECKEELSPSATRITTSIEFIYPTITTRKVNDEMKSMNVGRTTTNIQDIYTVSEDKNDEGSTIATTPIIKRIHDEYPVQIPGTARQQQQHLEDGIVTPVMSNRLHLRGEVPPLLSLPPSSYASPSSSNQQLRYPNKNSNYSSFIKQEHDQRKVTDGTELVYSFSSSASAKFSCEQEEPIIMSSSMIHNWKYGNKISPFRTDSDPRRHGVHNMQLAIRKKALMSKRTSTYMDMALTSQDYVQAMSLMLNLAKYRIYCMVNVGWFRSIYQTKYNKNERSNVLNGGSSSPTLLLAPHAAVNGGNLHKSNILVSNDSDPALQSKKMEKERPPAKLDTGATLLSNSSTFAIIQNRVSSTSNGKNVNGIRNYGQTCFLNSVLQALASLDPFIVYLDHIVQRNVQQQQIHDSMQEIPSSIPSLGSRKSKSLICESVLNTLLAINNEQQRQRNNQWIDPRPILHAVGQKHGQFRRRYGGGIIASIGEQQDAQEFLQAVLGMIVDEGQFDRIPPPMAVTSNIVSSFQQKRCMDATNDESNLEDDDDDGELSLCSSVGNVSKAMEIMATTTSGVSPCPLSVWCGSALMCAKCQKVRPIQNVPFLDIPIIPTATTSQYHVRGGRQKYAAQNASCRLEECLAEFTAIERVVDVECRNCTIQSEIGNEESEKELLSCIVEGITSRRSCRNQTPYHGGDDNYETNTSDETKHLLNDLEAIEERLSYLRQLSPDDDSEVLYKYNGADSNSMEEFDEGSPPKEAIALERSDAFKCLLLTRLPAILSIHVQRRYYDPLTGKTSKTMQHVNFPEMLDVSPFCAYGGGGLRQQPHATFAGSIPSTALSATDSTTGVRNPYTRNHPIWYKVMAVIEHRGGPYCGHYVCYRRDPTRQRGWLFISDDIIRKCSWNDVRNCQAYMLFYEAT